MKLDDVLHLSEFASDPFPFYREMQEADPVQWSKAWNCWVITRYDDVRTCLQDFRRFSNVGRVTWLFHQYFDPAQIQTLQPLISHYSHGLINVDPPDHTRIRRLLHEVFKPSTIGRLASNVQTYVDELLKMKRPSGRMKVVHDFAHPLPVYVIAKLFGVPESDIHFFVRWSAGIVEFMQKPQPTFDMCIRSQNALLEMRDYLRIAIADRTSRPRDDVLTHMVQAVVDGDRLTEDEILGTSVTILLGGHETTTRLLATTVVELSRQPEQLARLRNDQNLMETAVEEFLRYCGPFHRDQRVAIVDTEIGSARIRKGDFILLLLAAANRDARQFPEPDRFDLGRIPNRHLAFGFGPHICLGAPLARLEMAIAVRTFLNETPAFRLADVPLQWEIGFLRGPLEVEIEFSS